MPTESPRVIAMSRVLLKSQKNAKMTAKSKAIHFARRPVARPFAVPSPRRIPRCATQGTDDLRRRSASNWQNLRSAKGHPTLRDGHFGCGRDEHGGCLDGRIFAHLACENITSQWCIVLPSSYPMGYTLQFKAPQSTNRALHRAKFPATVASTAPLHSNQIPKPPWA